MGNDRGVFYCGFRNAGYGEFVDSPGPVSVIKSFQFCNGTFIYRD